jgi:hypothetical protein
MAGSGEYQARQLTSGDPSYLSESDSLPKDLVAVANVLEASCTARHRLAERQAPVEPGMLRSHRSSRLTDIHRSAALLTGRAKGLVQERLRDSETSSNHIHFADETLQDAASRWERLTSPPDQRSRWEGSSEFQDRRK